jgi:DNA invertase Pin-like site-specific DNA recombinase
MPTSLSAANVQNCEKEQIMNKQITVLYERLSVDDGTDAESNSIANQKQLLSEYAERNNLPNPTHMWDDGWSGVRWDRPGFNQMLAEIQAGNVAAVCVKDSSRIGRDYLRVGLFVEMLQNAGVRLICVNDAIDTFDHDDEFMPFRNIIHEFYVRDTSRKIKSSLQTKGKSGKPLSTKPPYGYYKDSKDKNIWRVDQEAAAVVRRVFDLTIEGFGPFEICRILHDDKIERPSYYMTKRGYVNYSGALDAKDPYLWGMHTVTFILARLEYAGHTVNFRSVKPSYKSKKQIALPPEQWLVFENTHEPIVSQATWDLAQKCREVVRRTDTVGEANPLTGLIFCADCGKRMYNHRNIRKVSHYTCSGYTQGRQRFQDEHCSPHYVTTEQIRAILLDVIQTTTAYVREYEDDFIERVRQLSSLKQGETVKTHTRQIAKNEKRIAELDKLFSNLYEDKVGGAITAERFAQMSGDFEREQAELREKNITLQAELNAFNEDNERADRFIAIVQKFTRIEELSAQIINEFVDKIVVYESVWSEQTETERRKGTRHQEIDVYLKYIGNFNTPDLRTLEEIEAERIAEEKLERKRTQKRDSERRRREAKRQREAAEQTVVTA